MASISLAHHVRRDLPGSVVIPCIFDTLIVNTSWAEAFHVMSSGAPTLRRSKDDSLTLHST